MGDSDSRTWHKLQVHCATLLAMVLIAEQGKDYNQVQLHSPFETSLKALNSASDVIARQITVYKEVLNVKGPKSIRHYRSNINFTAVISSL